MLKDLSPYLAYAAAVATLCFLLSPLLEVQRLQRSKGETLKDVCPMNLLLMLVNSALWLWYAIFFPLPPLVLSNTIGLAACCYSLSICWFYARHRREQTWGRATLTRTLLSFAAIFLALVYAASSSSHVQQVGYMAMVVSILSYGAPLAVLSRVVVGRCSRPLPAAQCFLALSCSFLWLCVGVIEQSIPLIFPNVCGLFLATLQLFLIWLYPRTEHTELSKGLEGPGKTLLANSHSQKQQIQLEKVARITWEDQYLKSLRRGRKSLRHSKNSSAATSHQPFFLVGICTDAD